MCWVDFLIIAWNGGGSVPHPYQELPSIDTPEGTVSPVFGYEIFYNAVILCRLVGSAPTDAPIGIGAVFDQFRKS